VPLYCFSSKACQRTCIFEKINTRLLFSFFAQRNFHHPCADYKGNPYFVLREFS
jgi:hypothetical protein